MAEDAGSGDFEGVEAPALRNAASAAIAGNARVFDPGTVIVPALAMMHERAGKPASEDELRLWRHAVDFLLARSEHPPEPPTDWRLDVKISCACEDCRGLQVFVLDPAARKHFKPTEILSSDACRGMVWDDENSQAATKDAFEVLRFVVRKRLGAGKLTVVDATSS